MYAKTPGTDLVFMQLYLPFIIVVAAALIALANANMFVKGDKVRERLESDQARARSVGVKTAPTLFVDKREMGLNDRTPEGVRTLVDEAVKRKASTLEKR
jgi:predicted DsbA family dithiol-disulfide isomerase